MSEYDKEPLSRAEEILDETSSGTGYDKEPLSRVEFRLKEVMAKIDGLVPDATVYKAGGSVTFANLPSPSKSTLGYVYDVSDAFTTTSDFKEGSGKKYPAGTNVAIVDIGTDENPIYKYDVLSGFIDMDNYVEKEAGKGLSSNDFTNEAKNKLDDLENYDDTEIKNDISELETGKVDKVSGKSLSTNDYTDADKALVANSPITVTATASPISTANGKPRAITIYGKSEVVDGTIKSAGDSGSIEIETCEKNLLDPTKLVTENITYIDGTLSGTAGSFNDAYRYGIPILFDKTKQITFSAKIYTNGADPNGDGFRVLFVYQDNTSNVLYIPNNATSSQVYTLTSNVAKQIKYIGITFGSAGINIWYLSEIQLEYGSTATAYEPYNGTMAVFSTGTPLRDITGGARDVMEWDGSAGTVTKKCGKVDLSQLKWIYLSAYTVFGAVISGMKIATTGQERVEGIISSRYPVTTNYISTAQMDNKSMMKDINSSYLYIKDTDYTDATAFKNSLNDAELVYELEAPTTTPLTQTENESLSALKTYAPQTTITINDNPEFEVEAYANTANGQAISDMQTTVSPLLTLSASGWSNNAQTVTYAHNTSKRNVIDVEPASIKAWTAAGILATSETTSTITFECDTVPTADLSFRVTSMEVR